MLLELVMIVKNSGEILRNCLKNNKKYIDYWTIVDTGSTDNTKEIIKETLNDIDGNLYECEFLDFSQARNKSLELSSKKCKYKIVLDDSYFIHGGENLLKILKKSTKDCLMIRIGEYNNNLLENQYFSKRIIKTSANLKYKYKVHEEIDYKHDHYIENQTIFINDIKDKSHYLRTFERFKKDIVLLKQDLENYPKNPKIIYYIAKTSQQLQNYDESIIYYEMLKQINNISEQYIFTAYYEIACIKYKNNRNKELFKEQLNFIISIFPKRVEPYYKLAVIYKNENNIELSNDLIQKIMLFPKIKNPITIIEYDIQDYSIPYLYIELQILLKEFNKAEIILKKLLTLYPINQALLNIKYNISNNNTNDYISLSNFKTIIFHCGGGPDSLINIWNPKGDKNLSGSEYMAINLAKEFIKLGYRLIIFGPFESKNIDNQCIHENIQYIDYKYFHEFCTKYIIDILVCSRFVSNLVYYDNIKKVYLWVHDELPIFDNISKFIQRHQTKFKGIISISEWQKQNINKQLDIPLEDIILSRNAIYKNRFLNKNIKKIPYRFIYSSTANRGLNYLIDMIQKIKLKYPETTLYIFCNKNFIDIETQKIIQNLDYVYLNDRIHQDELANEFLKSDIWLYPTNFKETYCITALEAMAAKCLVVTVDYCGLGNIVNGKGILCDSPIEDNIDELLNKLFFVLERSNLKNFFIGKAYEWAINQTYEKLALEWIKIFNI